MYIWCLVGFLVRNAVLELAVEHCGALAIVRIGDILVCGDCASSSCPEMIEKRKWLPGTRSGWNGLRFLQWHIYQKATGRSEPLQRVHLEGVTHLTWVVCGSWHGDGDGDGGGRRRGT